MSRAAKTLEAARANPRDVRFAALCSLLEAIGYSEARKRGSHRIYEAPGLPMINLQEGSSGKAKPYQVRQVLDIIDSHGLEVP